MNVIAMKEEVPIMADCVENDSNRNASQFGDVVLIGVGYRYQEHQRFSPDGSGSSFTLEPYLTCRQESIFDVGLSSLPEFQTL